MATKRNRRVLPDTDRRPLAIAKGAKAADSAERIELTVMLRPRGGPEAHRAHEETWAAMASALPEERSYLTRDEYTDRRGADPADVDVIARFAHDYDLTVTETSLPQRLVKLSGTLGALSLAFGARVSRVKVGRVPYRIRTGTLSVPEALADIVVGVFGFDTRPVARPHYRTSGPERPAALEASAKAVAAALKAFTAPQVATLYDFPTGLDGTGQCIALIELNTPNANNKLGTGYTTADLKTYFSKLGIPMPPITAIGVDGGANLPNVNTDADGEVMLDIEVAGAVAPGARIAVYFGPNTNKGFVDVISAAVHDNVRKPSVISISWGGPEDPPYTTAQQRKALDAILQDAATLGITVCCASGDNGSADLPKTDDAGHPIRDKKPHVDFPSSSPFALACGGTTLVASGTAIGGETVWNEGDAGGAGGGGVSNYFAKPAYQGSVTVPKSPSGTVGRGVPDVAGNADPKSGYLCKLAGTAKLVPIGGTSAVAPLWAGLIARINQKLLGAGKKPAGFVNALLYANPAAFHDITGGNNDIDGTLHKYAAAQGWDPATGLGSPDGTKIMKALGG